MGAVALQQTLDQSHNLQSERIESLRFLPSGEILKPVLLGYHTLGADLIWLHAVQVLGNEKVTAQDYEWLYHSLDVLTTLDPQYAYVYDAGGTILAELANRVDLSNQLLEKGFKSNPTVWRIPFVLGFNHFFHLQDYQQAAGYMAAAAKIPGRPYHVDSLAARLYVEGGSPSLALQYLELMMQQTRDKKLLAMYDERYKEVLIVRDLKMMEEAVARYRQAKGKTPASLADLVAAGLLRTIPEEPFGGTYEFNPKTGEIASSTHPERLHLYRPYEARNFKVGI
jgi:tetratricopeptide (TPR) repeat protein